MSIMFFLLLTFSLHALSFTVACSPVPAAKPTLSISLAVAGEDDSETPDFEVPSASPRKLKLSPVIPSDTFKTCEGYLDKFSPHRLKGFQMRWCYICKLDLLYYRQGEINPAGSLRIDSRTKITELSDNQMTVAREGGR